jgi:hypothetical protein
MMNDEEPQWFVARKDKTMIRKMMWAVLAVGAMLIVAPLVIGLPDKADGGQQMIDAFDPIMDQQNVDTTADYYYDVFVPLGGVAPAMSQENVDKFNGYLAGFGALGVDAQNMVPTLAAAMGIPEADVQAFMGAQFPAMTQTLQGLPQMEEDFGDLLGLMDANVAIFEQVPAGLDHYEPLVTTMQSEVGNYDKVASLPDFRLFTWFFIVPGLLLVGLAMAGLFAKRDTPEVLVEQVEQVEERTLQGVG